MRRTPGLSNAQEAIEASIPEGLPKGRSRYRNRRRFCGGHDGREHVWTFGVLYGVQFRLRAFHSEICSGCGKKRYRDGRELKGEGAMTGQGPVVAHQVGAPAWELEAAGIETRTPALTRSRLAATSETKAQQESSSANAADTDLKAGSS